MYAHSEEKSVEKVCFESEHICKNIELIKKQFKKYFSEFIESGNNSASYSNLICNKTETENKNKNIKQNIEQKIETDKNINVKRVFLKDNLDNTDDPVLFKIVLG